MSIKKINVDIISKRERGYLMGIIIGDGYLYKDRWRHYKTNIFLNPVKDIEISKRIIKILDKIGINPYFMNHHGCHIIRFNSKLFFNFFNKEFKHIKSRENKNFMIGFVSGLIDSDGYVSYGDIVISNVKKEILDITKEFCDNLGLKTKIWKKDNSFDDKNFFIWKLRIGTSFKYEKHYSQKINRIYGGCATHYSEQ